MTEYKDMYKTLENKPSWKYIDPLNLTTKDIENMCNEMTLDVERKKTDKKVEQKLNIPIMATVFYYYVFEKKKIPTQKEFMHYYIRSNKKWVQKNLQTDELKEALLGRLSRTYPSLLRDIHFYHLLKESGKFENVLFNLKYDLKGKVDVFVQKNKKAYGLQLRTLTKNSNFYYEKKPNRGAIPPKAVLIDLPINLDDAVNVKTKKQSVKLYGQKQINQVILAIKENSKEKEEIK